MHEYAALPHVGLSGKQTLESEVLHRIWNLVG
jgi:hypothetical protein